MNPVHTMDEAATLLHKSRRWLQDWLGDHPADRFGNPFFAQLGRTKVFTDDDLNRILAACKEDQRCPSSSTRRVRSIHPWLQPAQAFAVFAAADAIDAELGLFLRVLCYTGMLLSEALSVTLAQVDLEGETIYRPKTKNDDPRNVYLPPELVVALANHPCGLNRQGRLFRFHVCGRLRIWL